MLARLSFLFFLFPLLLEAAICPFDVKFWVIKQEFIKFGKRDLYEKLQKEGILKEKEGDFDCMLVMQDEADPEYIYLYPLENFSLLERSFSEGSQEKLNLINFEIPTLHENLTTLSYLPQGIDLFESPYIGYFIYSIDPENARGFEIRLEEELAQLKNKPSLYWLILKVLMGADIPKYVICFFAKTKEVFDQYVKSDPFKTPINREWIRRKQSGRAKLRTDLSLVDYKQKVSNEPIPINLFMIFSHFSAPNQMIDFCPYF